MIGRNLWFTSSMLQPLPDEEDETNPGRFGKALAVWLRDRLIEHGRAIQDDIVPEDWGWLIRVQKKPYSLWIGCGNEEESTTRWCVFVSAEWAWFAKLFKHMNPTDDIAKLENAIERIVREEPSISDVEWE